MNDPAEERTHIQGPPSDSPGNGAPCNGHQLDKSILTYLQDMIDYCGKYHHRDMVWYYEAGWEFAAQKIYGKLPPLKGFSFGQDPASIKTKFPAGATRPPEPWPLKKIIKRFAVEWNGYNITYETLECLHIIDGPSGWEAPVKRRRCIHCAVAAQPKKKSAASAMSAPLTKAVGA